MSDNINDYAKIKELGRTSTGITYLAKDTTTDKLVALKEINRFSCDVMRDLAAEQLLKKNHKEFVPTKVIVLIDEKSRVLRTNFRDADLIKGRQYSYIKNKDDSVILWEELSCYDDYDLFFIRDLIECGSVASILRSHFVLSEEIIKSFVYQILCMLDDLHKQDIYMKFMDNKSVLVRLDGTLVFTNYYLNKDKLQDIRLSIAEKETSYFFVPDGSLDKKISEYCNCHVCNFIVPCDCNDCLSKTCTKRKELFKSDVYSLGMMILEMLYGDFNSLQDEYSKEIDQIVLKANNLLKEEEEYYPISQDVRIKDLKENCKEIARKFKKGTVCEECKDKPVVKDENSLCSYICKFKKQKEIMKEVTNTRKFKTKLSIPDDLFSIIIQCLTNDDRKRPSVSELLEHKYFDDIRVYKKEGAIDFYSFNEEYNKNQEFFKKINKKLLE